MTEFVPCPNCHNVVLDTPEERRLHRAHDKQTADVIEAIRRTAKRAEDAANAAVALARDLHNDLDRIDGRLKTVTDAPDQPTVVVNEWPEDELDDPEHPTGYDDTDDDEPEPAQAPLTALQAPADADDDDDFAPAYFPGRGLPDPA